MGTGAGGLLSSGFGESVAKSGHQLATQLAGMESQHNLAQRGQLMQLLGMGLQPQEEIGYFAGRPGALSGIAGGVGQGLGALLPSVGGAVAGPVGGAVGTGANAIVQLLLSLLGRGQQQQQTPGSVSFEQPRYKV